MSIDLVYQTSDGYPGGFVAKFDGYMCFIEPKAKDSHINYRWLIQEGGGWTHRGGDSVKTLIEGTAMASTEAEAQIIQWLEERQPEA